MGFKSMVIGRLAAISQRGVAHDKRLNAIEERLDELEEARDVDNLPPLVCVTPTPLSTDFVPVKLPDHALRRLGATIADVSSRPFVADKADVTARDIASSVLGKFWRSFGHIDARYAYSEYERLGGLEAEKRPGATWQWRNGGLVELGYRHIPFSGFLWEPVNAECDAG